MASLRDEDRCMAAPTGLPGTRDELGPKAGGTSDRDSDGDPEDDNGAITFDMLVAVVAVEVVGR